MRTITMFTMATCPYCKEAVRWMNELMAEHPEYAEIPMRVIDETEQRALADQYDYYYVPTYYVEDQKCHEGAATKAKIDAVYRKALTA